MCNQSGESAYMSCLPRYETRFFSRCAKLVSLAFDVTMCRHKQMSAGYHSHLHLVVVGKDCSYAHGAGTGNLNQGSNSSSALEIAERNEGVECSTQGCEHVTMAADWIECEAYSSIAGHPCVQYISAMIRAAREVHPLKG